MVVSVGSCSIVVGIWAENETESLLLSLREVALGILWLTRREVVGRLTGRVGVLIVVLLALRGESETRDSSMLRRWLSSSANGGRASSFNSARRMSASKR